MREITIHILCNDETKDVRATVTEKLIEQGESVTYPLSNFTLGFIANIGPLSFVDAAKDVRNQYLFRQSWAMLPDYVYIPEIPTPTISRSPEVEAVCALLDREDLDGEAEQ